MRARRSFRPACLDVSTLEDRVVLNGGGGGLQGSPVLLQGLHAPRRVFNPHGNPAASSLVDLAFQSFQQDFQSVRATYLAAVENRTATAADTLAFNAYIQQRADLLAEQVTNSLLVYSLSTSRGHRTADPLPLIVSRLNGAMDARGAAPRQPSGTLVMNLQNTTPAVGASSTTIAVDTIAQDNAIQANRVATLNSVTIIRNGNFGTNNGGHKH
jgi:hypothetical protein